MKYKVGQWLQLIWADGSKEVVRVRGTDQQDNPQHPSVTVTCAGPKPIKYIYLNQDWPAIKETASRRLGRLPVLDPVDLPPLL